jgi:hypothetical protein
MRYTINNKIDITPGLVNRLRKGDEVVIFAPTKEIDELKDMFLQAVVSADCRYQIGRILYLPTVGLTDKYDDINTPKAFSRTVYLVSRKEVDYV